MDSSNIKVEVEGRRARSTHKGSISLYTYFLWKDKPYPLNYIAGSVERISRVLGITELDAEKLLIEKLEELLPTITDEKLKVAVEERIKKLRRDPPKWMTELRTCELEACQNKFYPRKHNQVFCSWICMRKSYRSPRKKSGRITIKTMTIKGLGCPSCPYCNGATFRKGTQQRGDKTIQRYKCYSCRKTFLEDYIEKRGANK